MKTRFLVFIPFIASMVFIIGCAEDVRKEMIRRDETFETDINKIQDKTMTAENRLDEMSNMMIQMNNTNTENQNALSAKIDGLQKQVDTNLKASEKLADEIDKRDKKNEEKLRAMLGEILDENEKIIERIKYIESQLYSSGGQSSSPSSSSSTKKRKSASKAVSAGSDSQSSSGGQYTEHVVEAGESLSKIARTYGVSQSDIMNENNMSSDIIRVGQKLKIPAKN